MYESTRCKRGATKDEGRYTYRKASREALHRRKPESLKKEIHNILMEKRMRKAHGLVGEDVQDGRGGRYNLCRRSNLPDWDSTTQQTTIQHLKNHYIWTKRKQPNNSRRKRDLRRFRAGFFLHFRDLHLRTRLGCPIPLAPDVFPVVCNRGQSLDILGY